MRSRLFTFRDACFECLRSRTSSPGVRGRRCRPKAYADGNNCQDADRYPAGPLRLHATPFVVHMGKMITLPVCAFPRLRRQGGLSLAQQDADKRGKVLLTYVNNNINNAAHSGRGMT